MTEKQVSPRELTKLGWLADAPLFIDTEHVAAFYDAVVRPEAERKKITLSLKSMESEKTTTSGELTTEVSIAKWITTIFPFLDAKIGGKVAAASEAEHGTESAREIELQPINSPQRQLVQLALHYAVNLPNRIRVISNPTDRSWYDDLYAQALPRALVFIDFPAKSAFMPMAVELDNGKVVLIYDEYAKSLVDEKKSPNPRPDDRKLTEEQKATAWRNYWKWYSDHFDSYIAMRTIESQVGSGGRVRWIDYRFPLSSDGETVHLHLAGHGSFDTGVFAYNLVRRGFEHGLRLVGTLKSGQDINVLAIFEK
jgi:hypothetical protein